MVNIDTHRIIDLIDSREIADVAEWLKTYPNLEIVSRDGSVSYKSAIKRAGEDIIQISDRFHLLKGLTDSAKKHMTSIVIANLWIPSAPSHYDGTEEMDYWNKETKEDLPTKEHNVNCEKKRRLVKEVVLLTEQGYKTTKIAEELGLSYSTVKKYQSADFNPVNGCYHTTTGSKIKPYADEIKNMLGNGNTFKEIEEEIRKKGYDGASSTIRMFTTRERKLRKESQKGEQEPVDKIERKWLIRSN